jgi:hypothetical protein
VLNTPGVPKSATMSLRAASGMFALGRIAARARQDTSRSDALCRRGFACAATPWTSEKLRGSPNGSCNENQDARSDETGNEIGKPARLEPDA